MHEWKVILLQVPWWLPTTCAHPKSASLRTATAATVATTRTSVTSSPSFSQRTPASVSYPSAQQLSDQMFTTLFSSALFYCTLVLSVPLNSVLLLSIFTHSALLVSFLFCSFILSFLYLSLLLSVSPSNQIYPIAMLALLSLCIIAEPVILQHGVWMCECLCVRLCACLKAVAELLLQISDRKRLFHPALLHNNFN